MAGFIEKAGNLSAAVLIAPQQLPDGGELAILLGHEGIPFGMYKPAR
jgi:hypothetical protein